MRSGVVIRGLRTLGISALGILLFLFGSVQFQQRLFRHRAERLLADFQSIRLHQSTWTEAQVLMQRWGAWGHYDGQCNSSDCAYTIIIGDTGGTILRNLPERFAPRLYTLYKKLGGLDGFITVNFLIQDGTIWRSSVAVETEDVGVDALASDSLHRYQANGVYAWGNDDQLLQHPNYKWGRPDACTGCLRARVTFTPYISPADLKKLTTYDLSCLTSRPACASIPDMLPIASDWHLYPDTEPAYQPSPPTLIQKACEVPIYLRARDAISILAVDVLSTNTVVEKQNGAPPYGYSLNVQSAKARLVQTIKGRSPATVGNQLEIKPFAGSPVDNSGEQPEHLEAGKHYIILPYDDPPAGQFGPKLEADFCGVFEDSAKVREQITRGMALNDSLRRSLNFGSYLW